MTAYIPFISLIRLTCVCIWQYLLDNIFFKCFFRAAGYRMFRNERKQSLFRKRKNGFFVTHTSQSLKAMNNSSRNQDWQWESIVIRLIFVKLEQPYLEKLSQKVILKLFFLGTVNFLTKADLMKSCIRTKKEKKNKFFYFSR